MEPLIGFFDVELVADDPFVGVGPSDVVDEVDEAW